MKVPNILGDFADAALQVLVVITASILVIFLTLFIAVGLVLLLFGVGLGILGTIFKGVFNIDLTGFTTLTVRTTATLGLLSFDAFAAAFAILYNVIQYWSVQFLNIFIGFVDSLGYTNQFGQQVSYFRIGLLDYNPFDTTQITTLYQQFTGTIINALVQLGWVNTSATA